MHAIAARGDVGMTQIRPGIISDECFTFGNGAVVNCNSDVTFLYDKCEQPIASTSRH